MKLSTLFFAVSLLVAAWAEEDDLSTITTSDDPTSTTDAPESTITLPPASCSSAGFDHCYRVIAVLTPTVYVILTADDPATVADAEPITSGDPILTQTDNIVSSGESVSVPTTAIVAVYYSTSTGTACDPDTITSTLTNNAETTCLQASAPFFTSPDQVTKTRVIRKVREDDTQGKGTETGGGGGQTGPTPAPGSATDGNLPAVTTDPAPEPTGGDTPTEPAPTDGGAPTTEDNPQPTEGTTEGATEEPTEGPIEEPTEGPIEEPTRINESGKSEVSTAFTTIAEVSDGSTKFVTSAVATTTISAPSQATSDGGSGAGQNFLVKAQVLFGAVGLAAVVGL